jgi:hypothetical protein
MLRWIRKDRRTYHDSHCQLCGANYGIVKGSRRRCGTSTCKACGSVQCSVNGLGRGQCSICTIGLLTGWSGTDKPCNYKGCTERAIVRVDGQNPYRCMQHLERGKWAGYLARRIEERSKFWVEVDDQYVTDVL